jgi:hypothetical protein
MGDFRIVTFSHVTVKQFLSSAWLAESGDLSQYYIDPKHAHTILAQACLGVLLHPGNLTEENGNSKRSHSFGYAAEHWVTHTQFAGVPSCLRKAMEYLFDPDRPHFVAWAKTHNVDTKPGPDSPLYPFALDAPTCLASPLYYAALCGFQDLVEHLHDKYPQQLNSHGGWYVTPLAAALGRRHFETVEFLYQKGAEIDVLGSQEMTPFICLSRHGDVDMVQRLLLDYKANVNAKTMYNWSALHFASMRDPRKGIAQFLLQHGAEVDAQGGEGCTTPLHLAVGSRRVKVVRMLLEHGANVDAEDDEGKTPFQTAAARKFNEIMEVLMEYGAK